MLANHSLRAQQSAVFHAYVMPARVDALFGLGIVTGTTLVNGIQPDKHYGLFLS